MAAQIHMAGSTWTKVSRQLESSSRRPSKSMATALTANHGRASAIRQHVLEMPGRPVVADARGYHQVHHSQTRGPSWGTWTRYASGDHLRSPSG